MTKILNPAIRHGGKDTIVVTGGGVSTVRSELAIPTISDTPLDFVRASLAASMVLPENDGTNLTGWTADEQVDTGDLTLTDDGVLINTPGRYRITGRVSYGLLGVDGATQFRGSAVLGLALDPTLDENGTVLDENRFVSDNYSSTATARHSAGVMYEGVLTAGLTVKLRTFIDRSSGSSNMEIQDSSWLSVSRIPDVALLGNRGLPGPPGADGLGVPPGGDTDAYLVKASAADNDTQWVTFAPGGGGLSRSYTYYKHYQTNQTYPRGSWQTIKLGTTNNAYPSPTNNTQIHQFQISFINVTGGAPAYVRYQYNQVEEADKTGPSSAQMWSGGDSDKQHWAHMFEHQGSTVQIEMYMPGSGNYTVNYIIVKCHALAAP